MVNAFTSETPQFIYAPACVWILVANCLEGSSCEATSVAGELLVALGKHMSLPNGFPKGCETHETPANENTMKQQGHWQLMLIVLFRSRLFATKKKKRDYSKSNPWSQFPAVVIQRVLAGWKRTLSLTGFLVSYLVVWAGRRWRPLVSCGLRRLRVSWTLLVYQMLQTAFHGLSHV